ncbi:hypothetical protein HDU76_008060 [Blyttiomyces sp. JEL0837]|nr:hypothetical protein HDU76_008060 [Blyttiomyces sp. JEL0837]
MFTRISRFANTSRLPRCTIANPVLLTTISHTRSYAAPTLTQEEVQIALKRAPRSRNDNMVDSSKIYFYEVYRKILDNRAVFIFQNNNMTAPEYLHFKHEFRKAGFTVNFLRNGLFGAAAFDHAADHKLGELKNMKKLLVGPSVAVFSNASDEERPRLLAEFLALSEKFTKKTLLVGGKLDSSVLSNDQLKTVSKLPPLQRLREELLGVLSGPAVMLRSVLEQNQKVLLMSLQQHEKALSEKEGGSKE